MHIWCFLSGLVLLSSVTLAIKQNSKPNIIFILADDLVSTMDYLCKFPDCKEDSLPNSHTVVLKPSIGVICMFYFGVRHLTLTVPFSPEIVNPLVPKSDIKFQGTLKFFFNHCSMFYCSFRDGMM